jgi:hypothetical protein
MHGGYVVLVLVVDLLDAESPRIQILETLDTSLKVRGNLLLFFEIGIKSRLLVLQLLEAFRPPCAILRQEEGAPCFLLGCISLAGLGGSNDLARSADLMHIRDHVVFGGLRGCSALEALALRLELFRGLPFSRIGFGLDYFSGFGALEFCHLLLDVA